MKGRFTLAALLVLLVGALAAGCGGSSKSSSGETDKGEGGAKAKVTLQLKWVTQAQFAGYYAAKAKGYYDEENLDVNLKVGGPSITPEQVVLGKQAEFGIDWLPSLLASRDKGQDLVNIAQVFDRSGMTELTWKDSSITSIGQMKGKKVGVWCCGNENELYAALNKNGMDPKKDVTIVNQPFDMNLFLNKQVDAAAAMTYNELAQVLETTNPKTGKLYQPSDINVIKMDDAGTGMLEDGVFVRGDWIKDKDHQEIAKRFLAASFRGWIYCRSHVSECTQIVLEQRAHARQGAPDVDDERDQRAGLAGSGRDRRDEQGRLRPDGQDRAAVRRDQEGAERRRLPHRPTRRTRSTRSPRRAPT